MTPTVASLLALSAMAAGAAVAGSSAPAPTASPVLIELFTSEGCSSCPPADNFLKQLDASQPIPGARLIVLGEHVDYWDNQGWPDPFSSAQLTERQRAYVRSLRLREAYTPQFVVDGAAELRLSERQKIAQVLKDAAASPKLPVRIEALKVDAGAPTFVMGSIAVDGTSERRKSDVYLGFALDHYESKVLRGENRGQSLEHVAVLVGLVRLGSLEPGQAFKQDFRVPLRAGTDGGNLRVIGFVQEAGDGKVVGATFDHTTAGAG